MGGAGGFNSYYCSIIILNTCTVDGPGRAGATGWPGRAGTGARVAGGQGHRGSIGPELGGAIAKLVLDAAVYTPLLGAGLDAEAAVAAFRARTEQ